MSTSPVAGARVPGPPPPPDRLRDRLRRRRAGLGAHPGLRHWLIVRGSVLLAGFAVLYAANVAVIGGRRTYDVTVGITSPGDPAITAPALAWPLSIAGWLAAPAVFGAVAGVVISLAVGNRRRRPIADVLTAPGRPAR